VQKWDDSIREQLNDLPGFPPAPTQTPPAPGEWVLGDWIGECHVRPEAADFASLPLTDNEIGDVRVSLADQAWFIWDGAVWQSMAGGGGGVASVTASAPLASSGGANPNISLTGIVAAANGGTGIAVPGAVGNVLTSTGAGWASSAPATTSPAAPLNSVQFNNGGAFGGSAALTWNGSTLAVDGAVDRATAGTLTVGGATATAITIGKVGVTTSFPGPVALDGDVTTVGGTQFTTDATFDGNVTFGNAASDNISFVGQVDTAITQEGIAAPAVSPAGTGRIYFDSGSNKFRASQNGGPFVDLIGAGGTVTSVTLDASTTGLTISGGASQTITTSGTFTLGGTLAVANGGTGTSTAFTPGSVVFAGASGVYAQDNANLFWDDANKRLGIGTATPGSLLTVDGGSASGAIAQVQSSVNGNVSLAVSNATSGTAAQASLYLVTDSGAGRYGSFSVNSNGWTTDGLSLPNQYQSSIEVGLTNGILFSTQAANAPIVFAVPTANGAGFSTTAERLRLNGSEVAVNDNFQNIDFRVESVANANMLLVDASQNSVSVGTSGNTHTFNVGAAGAANFCVASGGRIHTYDGSAPTDGQVLIGNGGAGNFAKATLTAGTGIAITNGAGSITIAATGAAASTTVDISSTAQEALLAGDLVRFVDDVGVPKVQKADATNTDTRLNPVGFAVAAASLGAAVTVRVAGVADVPAALFDAAPAVGDVGKRVFVSTTSGQVTLTAPSVSGDIVQRAGVLVDGGANPKVLVQIGDPILL